VVDMLLLSSCRYPVRISYGHPACNISVNGMRSMDVHDCSSDTKVMMLLMLLYVSKLPLFLDFLPLPRFSPSCCAL
jgi:hypothetical protein